MILKHYNILLIAFAVAPVLILGCSLGPDYHRPATIADSADHFASLNKSRAHTDTAEIDGPWWQRFGDKVTNDLVRQGLKNNTDLKVAAGRLLEAKALLQQSHGPRLPDISYSANRTRGKGSITLPIGGQQSFFFQTYTQEISISYIVDFFGKLKRTERAALADMLAVEANQHALVHSIIAQIVRSRVQIATLQKQLKIAQANTDSWKNTLEIVNRRYRLGLVSSLDVYIAKENLASAKAIEPQLNQSLILAGNSLDVLIARRPGTSKSLPETLPDLPDLKPVPVGLPAALLDQRPDVRAAELSLAAATERIGVSIAALYPDLTLTASSGFSSSTFANVTKNQSQIYSAIVAIAMPIFNGGRLRAKVDAARARTDQEAANYAGVILKAIRETEDALVSQQMLTLRLNQNKERLNYAMRAEDLARRRYARGLENLLLVLETQRRLRNAEDQLVRTKADLFNARIDLFLALGGDWQKKSPPGPSNEQENTTGKKL